MRSLLGLDKSGKSSKSSGQGPQRGPNIVHLPASAPTESATGTALDSKIEAIKVLRADLKRYKIPDETGLTETYLNNMSNIFEGVSEPWISPECLYHVDKAMQDLEDKYQQDKTSKESTYLPLSMLQANLLWLAATNSDASDSPFKDDQRHRSYADLVTKRATMSSNSSRFTNLDNYRFYPGLGLAEEEEVDETDPARDTEQNEDESWFN